MATSRVVRNAQLHHRLVARCTRSNAVHTAQVHVYDVDKNIMGPICTQKIARKAKLTKLAFNPRHPIIAVGEEKCAAGSQWAPKHPEHTLKSAEMLFLGAGASSQC
jgi:hypothetical protein